MEKMINIVIIDSGISEKIYFQKNKFYGFSVSKYLNTYQIESKDFEDKIGHGTAIVDIINNNLESVSIMMFKIYDDVLESEEEKMIFTLEYIYKNLKCDLLHISSGIVQIDKYHELYQICNKIYQKGTIIVSAFDNEGGISYPAAFPFVIGVDISNNKLKLSEYEYVEDSIINIRGSSSFHRVKWITPPTLLLKGTSFTSAYLTIKIVKLMKIGIKNIKEILVELKKDAKKIYKKNIYKEYNTDFIKNIHKAIVFPFNKEIHSLARFQNELFFKIEGFFDSKYSMQIGKTINSILDIKNSTEIIQDITNINWTGEFDTIILGHCRELNNITKIDWTKYFIEKAKKYNKKIFSFEEITDKEFCNSLYYPKVDLDMVPKNRFGKLRIINKPILGILGTSSQQGKFTLQNILRKMFLNEKYKVGQLGTEPQSELFGFDRVFPMGYNSSVSIHGIQTITLLNEYIWDISCQDNDIIIIGSQSGTVPYTFNHLSQFPIYQNTFLLGTCPDAVILCINPHDSIEYIKRTISYIQGLIDCYIIALVIFPVIQKEVNLSGAYKKTKLNINEIEKIKIYFKNNFDYDIFILGNNEDMKKLWNQIIEFF